MHEISFRMKLSTEFWKKKMRYVTASTANLAGIGNIKTEKVYYLNTSNRIWSKIIGPISGLSSKDTRIRNGFRSCGVSTRT